MMSDKGPQARLYMQCEKKHVKVVKTWLEELCALFKGEKIKSAGDAGDASAEKENGLMLIPTVGIVLQSGINYHGYSTTIQTAESLVSLSFDVRDLPQTTRDSIRARFFTATMPNDEGRDEGEEALNDLQKKFDMFLNLRSTFRTMEEINKNPDNSTHLSFKKLLSEAPKRWTLYPPLIMLPPGSFSAGWTRLLTASFRGDTDFLWQDILKAFSTDKVGYTHIAVNKGIPLDNEDEDDNTIRAPSSELQRLYGDFGPDIPSQRFYLPPYAKDLIGKEDFDEAFWVKTRQNGLVQVWAPRWTMFSRGNVKEKARVLTFEKAIEYTKEGKKNMPVLTPAQNRVLSGLRGLRTPGSNAKDAMVLDSSSDVQPSVSGATNAKNAIELDSSSKGLLSPHAIGNSASRVRFLDTINIYSSPVASPSPELSTEKELNAESDKRPNENLISQADVGLHLDGDAPADHRPMSKALNSHKRKLEGDDSRKLNKHGNPKFQEVQLALDLYAGIGYFTMSYLKLGYDVIAYELNPFSVEGLRRGAKANGFGCTVLRGKELLTLTSQAKRKSLVREVSWSIGGKDKKDPILLDDDDDKTVIDEGYASQNKEGHVNGDGVGDSAIQDTGAMVMDDDGVTSMVATPDEASKGKTQLAATDVSNNKEPIVIDDDDMNVDADPHFAEECLFGDQNGPVSVNATKNNDKAIGITNNTFTRKFVSVKTSAPMPPSGPTTLHSLETTLQGQFHRPPRVIICEQSNMNAYTNFLDLSTQHGNRGGNPYRIRHINLGFLPSSSDSWDTAAQLIMTNIDGGSVHVHENVGSQDIDRRREEVRSTFEELCNPYAGTGLKKREVTISHTELVKSYAPGVWHLVYDVRVGKKTANSIEENRDRVSDAGYYDGDGADTSDDAYASFDEQVFEGYQK